MQTSTLLIITILGRYHMLRMTLESILLIGSLSTSFASAIITCQDSAKTCTVVPLLVATLNRGHPL